MNNSMYETLTNQIKNQLTGRLTLDIRFIDCASEYITLFDRHDFSDMRGYYIKAPFCSTKQIPEAVWSELMQLVKWDGSIWEASYIDTQMKYDDFYNKFYNEIEKAA